MEQDPKPLFVPFSPAEPVEKYRGALPHWRQDRRTYFVTFRLADALPSETVKEWSEQRAAWMKAHPEPHSVEEQREFHRRFSKRMHAWLDAGHGACVLRRPEVRDMMETVLQHGHASAYDLGKFVIMPNHVHALVTPSEGCELSIILKGWKSVSAHSINKLLVRRGTLWQKESFDHIVRSEAQLLRIEQYILDNPKAKQSGR